MKKQIKKDMRANFHKIATDHREMLSLFSKSKPNLKIKVVYIAGKVTGLPYDEVFAKFNAYEMLLESMGYIVINPCRVIHPDEDWDLAMKICLNLLQFADNILMLPDWEDSKGAKVEKAHADVLNIPQLHLAITSLDGYLGTIMKWQAKN